MSRPGAIARSDARPPGMRTVAGSILMSGNILLWRLDWTGHEIVSTAILFLPLIQEGELSVTGERICISTGKLPTRLVQDQCG